MKPLPIALGSLPAVDTQVNNPRLQNAFVNPQGQIQLLPKVKIEQELGSLRAVHFSTFNDRFILVTFSEVYYYQNGALTRVGAITHSENPVRITENRQNQVTVVNGTGAWVFSQLTDGFVKLTLSNGFDIQNPVDTIVLDTLTIIVGGRDKKWTPSEANNALAYDGNIVQETDNLMGELRACEVLNNNLFIFGEGGVQRWIPSIERVPNAFPFSQDPSYRDEYGCAATGSVISDKNKLYYLTEKGQVRIITSSGDNIISEDGISTIINGYDDQSEATGSHFYHKGHYLYSLTFPKTQTSWIYCSASKKWSESTQLIIGYDTQPILKDGLYNFTDDYSDEYFEVIIQTPYMRVSAPQGLLRTALNAILLEITQGKGLSLDKQICDLQISKDNVLYGNRVRRVLSEAGKRLFELRWFMSIANNAFSVRFTLQVKQEIVIEKGWFNIIKGG